MADDADSPTLQIPVRVELGPDDPTLTPGSRDAPPRGGPARPPLKSAGRYLVEEEIGRGGMGIVYRAFDRALDLGPDDTRAARRTFDAALDLAAVASATEQWTVATRAARKALALAAALRGGTAGDVERARRALEEATLGPGRILEEHRTAVERVLADARSSRMSARPGGYEDAPFALVRYPEPQTVTLVATALDGVTERLRAAAREAYLSAATPTADERRAGAEPIAGLAEALDRALAVTPGADPAAGDAALIAIAAERIEARDARRRTTAASGFRARSAREIVAAAQEDRLGRADLDLARLSREALGRIGIAEGAVPALGRYLHAEAGEPRAAHAGVALCLLRGAEAARLISAGRRRFGTSGPYWTQIVRFLDRLGGVAELWARTADAYDERGLAALEEAMELKAYAKLDFVPVRGEGAWLWNAAGQRGLDFYGATRSA